MTLPEAVAFALHHNSQVQSAYLQRVLDKFNLELAQANYRIQPSLAVDTITTQLPGAFSRESDRQYGVVPSLNWNTPYSTQFNFAWSQTLNDGYYGHAESLTVTQPLLKGFGERIASMPLDLALDQEIQAKLNLRQTLMTTITAVINDYYGLVQSEMTANNNQMTLKADTQHLAADKLRVQAGDLAPTELTQDEYQVAQQRVQISAGSIAIKDARIKLENDLGLDNRVDIQVPLTVTEPTLHFDTALAEKIGLENSPQLLTDALTLKRDKMNLLQARDNSRWNLSLAATAARSSQHYNGGDSADSGLPLPPSTNTVVSDNQVSLNMTVPIGTQQLQNEQAIAAARLAEQNDQIKLNQDKSSFLNQIDDSVARLQADSTNIDLAAAALALQEKTLAVTKQKVQYGMTTNFEYFSQQATYFSAQQGLIQAKIQYLNDLAAFDQLLGTTLSTWNVEIKY